MEGVGPVVAGVTVVLVGRGATVVVDGAAVVDTVDVVAILMVG